VRACPGAANRLWLLRCAADLARAAPAGPGRGTTRPRNSDLQPALALAGSWRASGPVVRGWVFSLGGTVLLQPLFWVPPRRQNGLDGLGGDQQPARIWLAAPHSIGPAAQPVYERWLVAGPAPQDPGGIPMAVSPSGAAGLPDVGSIGFEQP